MASATKKQKVDEVLNEEVNIVCNASRQLMVWNAFRKRFFHFIHTPEKKKKFAHFSIVIHTYSGCTFDESLN